MSKTITPKDIQLREAFSKAIRDLLESGVSAARIAAEIGVRRQTVYLYRDKKVTPSARKVHRLCEEWSVTLDIGGFKFGEAAFSQPAKSSSKSEQLSLLKYLERLPPESFDIRVLGRVGEAFRIEVSIKPAKSA
jgi:transcriptional regulator with XRE-family HTH domain